VLRSSNCFFIVSLYRFANGRSFRDGFFTHKSVKGRVFIKKIWKPSSSVTFQWRIHYSWVFPLGAASGFLVRDAQTVCRLFRSYGLWSIYRVHESLQCDEFKPVVAVLTIMRRVMGVVFSNVLCSPPNPVRTIMRARLHGSAAIFVMSWKIRFERFSSVLSLLDQFVPPHSS
jgi:hypothetical protein